MIEIADLASQDGDSERMIEQLKRERARLEAVLQYLPVGVVIASAPSGEIVLGNAQVEHIWRHELRPAADVSEYAQYHGFNPDGTPLAPDDWPLARSLRTGEPVSGEEITFLRGDGSTGVMRVNSAAIIGDRNEIDAAVVVFDDITEQRQATEGLRFLTEASAVLASSLDYDTTLQSVVDLVVPRLADWCVVDIVDGDGGIRRVAMKHRDTSRHPLLVELEQRFPHRSDAPTGPSWVVRTGLTNYVPKVTPESVAATAGTGDYARLTLAIGIDSYVCVPLRARGRTLGAMSFVHTGSGRSFGAEDVVLLEEVGHRIAIAIDNAILFRDAALARDETRAQAKRLSILADASNAFAAARLDQQSILDTVARVVAEAIGDVCLIRLVSADGAYLQLAAIHDPDPDALMATKAFLGPLTHRIDEGLSGRVISSGSPILIPETNPDELQALVKPEYRPHLAQRRTHSIVIVPMRVRHRIIGAIALSRVVPGQPYTIDDQHLLEDLAERAGTAIENAELYDDVQTTERRYRNLFNGSLDAVLVINDQFHIVDANPAALALLGYAAGELRNLRAMDIVDVAQGWARVQFERLIADGTWTGEVMFRRKDGSTVPVEIAASAIATPRGDVFVASCRDITARRAAERLQREFITMVTHDLKSPLTSIRGFAQLMQRRERYSETAVESIVSQTGHLERLINDLLDAARLEVGRADLQRASVDLVELAQSIAGAVAAQTSRHAVSVEAHGATIRGEWDADRLAQVLQNLLSNAVKYSPDGGDIVVTLGTGKVNGASHAVVSVSDRGVGIPEGVRDRLFDRFYRVESTEHGAQGLGLGLYISRSLVEAHGGRIWVESTPGRGSTFTFTLPLS